MKKIKLTALVLCALMLAGIAGCQATDKPYETSSSQTEGVTEASSEDTQAVTEITEQVVTDSGVDFLEGYEKFELNSMSKQLVELPGEGDLMGVNTIKDLHTHLKITDCDTGSMAMLSSHLHGDLTSRISVQN